MLPTDRPDILEEGLRALRQFGQEAGVRGRFVALYLGLRRMHKLAKVGDTDLNTIGSGAVTPSRVIENFLDHLYTKTHRRKPFVVLTAPFGGSTSSEAPYSTRTGEQAPGRNYPTNTWRNNFGIQKGVGCPATPAVIRRLLNDPQRRLSCEHMTTDQGGGHRCGLANTTYRGEEHSVWMRLAQDGYQVSDLDHPAVYTDYLYPNGHSIPIFPLIAVLYSFAPADMYPTRNRVGIADFASDFDFDLTKIESLFNCDPRNRANVKVLSVTDSGPIIPTGLQPTTDKAPPRLPEEPSQAALLPDAAVDAILNTGVGAELMVAQDLIGRGWDVQYRGNQSGIGYDLEAKREADILRVEVKSSVAFTYPELQSSEWDAAQTYGDEFVLAVVDFYGSDMPRIWYVRNPAANSTPTERNSVVFRFTRSDLQPVSTDAEFL